MNIQELKDFRARLKYAKKLCALNGFNNRILKAFINAGLEHKCMIMRGDVIMPEDVYKWYIDPARTPIERAAMWNNSIAAIDARIAKSK